MHAVLRDRVQNAAAESEVYRIRIQSGAVQCSAHVPCAEEHLLVFSGTARVGPASAPFEVSPGSHARWAADVPHQYEAVGSDVEGVLVVRYPVE
ncbi:MULTISPECIES: cupin domain-containing protein [unclassified Streptomyces]|uniref:cupin domain-containing protein n=1 Tax=unclassified Streptomyces TaxID=2593676 RepID=UPI00224F8692|nr:MULTISPECIES: hypothetical protein [unclassified Streptomyces]MCX5140906.1 hypothetical protein [Streptomyces sp. NBC_00338]WRZ65410.1 hypothetical protein OG408_16655 [Streptomyces sp. NBC_01257]